MERERKREREGGRERERGRAGVREGERARERESKREREREREAVDDLALHRIWFGSAWPTRRYVCLDAHLCEQFAVSLVCISLCMCSSVTCTLSKAPYKFCVDKRDARGWGMPHCTAVCG